ncbi:hypothetical protein KDW_21660 [Dictyobacter vulcani]|uniref:Uncharacterized protein n=1 Tax=Dictyobacter vulcani TaxID=2607529 RepID=A0A5J4KF48_9CHLR|nr:hypothetical protein KDW_21660 [Dictyobacter vulcani]
MTILNSYIAVNYMRIEHRQLQAFGIAALPNVALAGMFSVYCIWLASCLFLLIRQDRRRHSAATGNSALLAISQPPPDETLYRVPIMIDQKINWSGYIKFALIICIILLLMYFIAALIEYSIWKTIFINEISIAMYFVVIAIFLIALAFVARSYAKVQLIVADTGLIKKSSRGDQFMSWNEVRLFAIDAVEGGKDVMTNFQTSYHHMPTLFEVSSAKDMLQWRFLRPPRWYEIAFAQPVMGYVVYEQQMQTLLAIIATKTKQPLYDLR